ncbi:MAG TPA: hypothetical protein VNV44_15330 [Solirubrobacteraceae bacterium]|jgi:hypothetical protein|nr:hypothetical protein [Solirubrobacteraceae bacterium]
MKAFVAHSFGEPARPLVAMIERLLASHDVPVTTGERVGGDAITPRVKRRIESVECLIAVMMKGEQIAGREAWRTHPWVEWELAHARDHEKLTIALIAGGVEVPGPYQEHERIALDPEDPLEALLALSETVHTWKGELGWARQIQLKPDELGHELHTSPELKCQYRLTNRQGVRTEWRETRPVTQPGGTIVYVTGVRGEDDFIEIEVRKGDHQKWLSLATAQLISVELLAPNGGS